ncbi:MAG TPA: hypothetical protein VM261_25885 [Kofleriaceae bacterium]|nr:hypothetical protein [Kofleriaceae bacterium]
MVIGKRAMLVTFIIAAIGLAACVVKTVPVHHQSHRPAEKHKKAKPQKHKKQKGHGHDH